MELTQAFGFAATVIASIIGFLVVGSLLLRAYFTLRRWQGTKGGISRWAKTVSFSQGQLTAMRSLWHWYKTGRLPSMEPLSALSTSEMADLIKKCEMTSMPREFHARNEAQRRQKLHSEVKSLGMNDLEAQVVVGMKCGKLGPANDQ